MQPDPNDVDAPLGGPYRAPAGGLDRQYLRAWREHQWRMRLGRVSTVFLAATVLLLAIRLRLWLVLILIPVPFTSVALLGFECPRCGERFAHGRGAHWWRARHQLRCVHCRLPLGAERDPDAAEAPPSVKTTR